MQSYHADGRAKVVVLQESNIDMPTAAMHIMRWGALLPELSSHLP